MPSGIRQFQIGGVYHIVNRGYDRRNIFLDKGDYMRFIESLFYFNTTGDVKVRDMRQTKYTGQTCVFMRSVKAQKNWKPIVEILAFTLMPNHYHLIIREIITGGISNFMQKLGTGYTAYFNTKYDRVGVGGIFQARYKHVCIENDSQLATVFTYVHTNPIELKEPKWKDLIVRDEGKAINWLERYWKSSYFDYVGWPTFPNVTQRDFFLDFFGGETACHEAIEDWIRFKARNATLGSEIIE
jgi:putative transposase